MKPLLLILSLGLIHASAQTQVTPVPQPSTDPTIEPSAPSSTENTKNSSKRASILAVLGTAPPVHTAASFNALS